MLPWASVAEQFTMVLPTGNREPEDGAHVAWTKLSTMSVADTEKFTMAPDVLVAVWVIGDGTDTTGAVVSRTVT